MTLSVKSERERKSEWTLFLRTIGSPDIPVSTLFGYAFANVEVPLRTAIRT